MAGNFGPQMPYRHQKTPFPKHIRQVPAYLKTVLGGFFGRFGYIIHLVWKAGKWIPFLLFFVAIFRGVMPVLISLVSKNILNALQEVIKLGNLPESEFWTSGILLLLIALISYRALQRIVTSVTTALNRIAGEKVANQVKKQIMEKSRELDVAAYDNPVFYEKMENANREAGNRPLMILSETFGAVSSIIELVSFLTILLTAPGLAWVTFAIVAVSIPSAVVNFVYRRKNFDYMRRRSKERRQMNYYSGVLVDKDLVKEVRLFDLADTFIDRFLQVFRGYYQGLRKLIFNESAWHVLFALLTGATNLIFYILIAKNVFTGTMQIGDYSLYTGAIASIATCITALINASGNVYEGTLFIDNLRAFMAEPQTVKPILPKPRLVEEGKQHTIEFVDVSFRYPGTARDILKHVNLKIHPGETVALVGLNGAGKTTLIKLLTRLYDPTAGKILLDGEDIREYDLKSLYRTFGIIFQDFGKYADTVENNIRFGSIHKNAPVSEVEFAATQSTAAEYIPNLPKGYDTPLMRIFEPEGRELSIGQWQKLAIARAFYAQSDIMILDEPTASLDPLAEQEIFNQFDKLRDDKMTVFVSHRLSSATVADQIVVLENGEIVEQGSHRELMEQQGKYHHLFTTQSKRYIEDAQERPRRPRPPFSGAMQL